MISGHGPGRRGGNGDGRGAGFQRDDRRQGRREDLQSRKQRKGLRGNRRRSRRGEKSQSIELLDKQIQRFVRQVYCVRRSGPLDHNVRGLSRQLLSQGIFEVVEAKTDPVDRVRHLDASDALLVGRRGNQILAEARRHGPASLARRRCGAPVRKRAATRAWQRTRRPL